MRIVLKEQLLNALMEYGSYNMKIRLLNCDQNSLKATAKIVKENAQLLRTGESGIRALYYKVCTMSNGIYSRYLTYILLESGINPLDYIDRICNQAYSDMDMDDFTVPGHISLIGEFAFSDCDWLQEVTMEEGVEIIQQYAFFRCRELRNIKIPKSVTVIQGSILKDCDKLTGVDYFGTKDEWAKIRKNTMRGKPFTVFCSDGIVEER